ncbi:MAG: hypothetical protein ACQZ3N_01110 [cyanobacterium endosymbiont of Rhopalodia yunnanensis]
MTHNFSFGLIHQSLQHHVITECSKQLTGIEQPCYRGREINPNIAKYLA